MAYLHRSRGIAAGMLLFTIMIDLIVRLVPGSWLWPERMAASILRMDEETAGVHLIKTAAPDRWRDIVAGYTIFNNNRAAIAQCERNGAKPAGAIQCVIELRK